MGLVGLADEVACLPICRRPWDPRIVEGSRRRDTSRGGFHCLCIPNAAPVGAVIDLVPRLLQDVVAN